MIEALLADGTIALFAAGLVVVEIIVVLAIGRLRNHPVAMQFLLNGVSGLCLMLALHAALIGPAFVQLGLFLTLSLVAHLIALAQLRRALADRISPSSRPA
jgi:hypothetical protein